MARKRTGENMSSEEVVLIESSEVEIGVVDVGKILQTFGTLTTAVIAVDKTTCVMDQLGELDVDIVSLYSMQNALNQIDSDMKKITKARAVLQPVFVEELQRRVDAGETEYDDFVIEPVMKTVNRSVDDDKLKDYYKSFYDSIIAAKISLLEKTYKPTIKDVETFMGSLADKVIIPSSEVFDKYS